MPNFWQSREGIITSIRRGLRIDKIKTGRVGHLADKYRPQMIRYRTILQGLFPRRQVECCLLFVDEPHRILTI